MPNKIDSNSARSIDSHYSLDGVENTLDNLRRKGVQIWIENGELRYRARKGVVTDTDIAKLRSADMRLFAHLSSLETTKRFEARLTARVNKTCAPLAFSQLAHWNFRELVQRCPVRQVASATRMKGPLQVSALQEALSEVVCRHEALRTRIAVRDGIPMQEVIEGASCGLEVSDLGQVAPGARDQEIRRYIDSAILDIANYAADPLFRGVLLRISEDEAVLILALDHIVSDGASLSVLLRETLTAYAQLVSGKPIALPEVRMHSIDYAIWQRSLADALNRQARECAVFRRTRFPEERTRIQEPGWSSVRFSISERLKTSLRDWSRSHGTSIVMVMLTLYFALVLRWCETSSSVIQVITDGRAHGPLENTIGYVAYPLYTHVTVNGRETFLDMLATVTQAYCRACERPDFFYSYVNNPGADFTRNTCFNWLPRSAQCEKVKLIENNELLNYTRMNFEHPLLKKLHLDAEPVIVLEEVENEIIGEMDFQSAKFSTATIHRFVRNLICFLETALNDPTGRIRDIAFVR